MVATAGKSGKVRRWQVQTLQHRRGVPSFIGAGNSTCDSSTAAWRPDLTWSAYVVHMHSCSGRCASGQATLPNERTDN